MVELDTSSYVKKIFKQTQLYRSSTPNEAFWTRTNAADFQKFKHMVHLETCISIDR